MSRDIFSRYIFIKIFSSLAERIRFETKSHLSFVFRNTRTLERKVEVDSRKQVRNDKVAEGITDAFEHAESGNTERGV